MVRLRERVYLAKYFSPEIALHRLKNVSMQTIIEADVRRKILGERFSALSEIYI
jgi:hypothetical protein